MKVEEERATCLGFEQRDRWPPRVADRFAGQLVMQAGKTQEVERCDGYRAWPPVPITGQLSPEPGF